MQLTWLIGAPSRSVSVHERAVGRVGLGSAATQLMRAVRPPPPGGEIGPCWLRLKRVRVSSTVSASPTAGRDASSRTGVISGFEVGGAGVADESWSLARLLVPSRRCLRQPAGISRASSARFSPISRSVRQSRLVYPGRLKRLRSLCERVVGGRRAIQSRRFWRVGEGQARPNNRMQLTWLTGAPSWPASVHRCACGRVGLGSSATQLMRAVGPLDSFGLASEGMEDT